MYFSYKKTAIMVIVFTLIITSLILLIAYRNKDIQNAYYLREYNGAVALFNGEDLIEVYDGVVIDNLPFNDYKRFADGIEVSGIDEAQIIMEDYDG